MALAAIPLLLALIGQGMADRSKLDINGTDVAAPSLPVPSVSLPGHARVSLSILRSGDVITVNGDLPDISARTGLLDMLEGVYGSGVQMVDNLNIKPGVSAPDLVSLGSLFKAGISMPDFKFKIEGDTVTLIGTAASGAVKSAVEAAAKAAWPNLKLSNDILVVPDVTETTRAAPAPRPAGDCADLQADITAVMSTPVTFATNGRTLSTATQQRLSRVAEKVKGCPSAHLAVSGYTDNTGNDGINIPLSTGRAKAVAEFLVAHGVPAANVTSKGYGSADPVASNAKPDGRAQNRRVVITVS
ncbi:OmpA family protein [Mycolicibacter sp. MYC098]|uniref:OmpA family protein n=1 Tax=[Mycobacterium] crassicus TaxID=2872309 RepID=A0ABU5XLJ9_9MYCO|nr:OmpA family protein [Mycolicibacter sp. MYC098]MEB3022859.1 OmpA family protein [Mycolicibacter sp. MYC098]